MFTDEQDENQNSTRMTKCKVEWRTQKLPQEPEKIYTRTSRCLKPRQNQRSWPQFRFPPKNLPIHTRTKEAGNSPSAVDHLNNLTTYVSPSSSTKPPHSSASPKSTKTATKRSAFATRRSKTNNVGTLRTVRV